VHDHHDPPTITGLNHLGAQLGVHRIFGDPIERDGVIVVPVALAIGGGGAGTGPDDESGGGFGGVVRPIGMYSLAHGHVRFIPVVDTTALAALALLLTWTLLRHGRRHG
jgi:uncharacterized spore protein YtfJ